MTRSVHDFVALHEQVLCLRHVSRSSPTKKKHPLPDAFSFISVRLGLVAAGEALAFTGDEDGEGEGDAYGWEQVVGVTFS